MTAFWPVLVLKMLLRRARRGVIMMAATAMAVACLIALDAVMEGVGDAMIRNSVAAAGGHVTLTGTARRAADEAVASEVRRWPGVCEALPRRTQAAMLSHGRSGAAVTLVGVVPAERNWSIVAAKIIGGGFPRGGGSILVGSDLADRLGAAVGDRLEATVSGGVGRTFTVCGVFRTRLPHLDAQLVLAGMDDVAPAQQSVHVFLADPYAAPAAAARAGELAVAASQWQNDLPELAGLISLNRFSMNVVLGLALLILAFGISNNVFQGVSQRRRELSILRAMGLTSRGVMAIVLGETMLMAAVAAVIGAAVGIAATLLWARWGLDLSPWTSGNPHFLISAVVYPRLTGGGVIAPMAVACACGFLAALAPARRAGRSTIMQGLRML
ncbi:MAG: FtsX-like permease family protein [Planctomycetaceae bacterium]|nr:FtsX-like permease family protein [Planctomycetaceae bacterium]